MGKETGLYHVGQVGSYFAVFQRVEPVPDEEGYGRQQVSEAFPTCQEAMAALEGITSKLRRDAGAAKQAGFENHAR